MGQNQVFFIERYPLCRGSFFRGFTIGTYILPSAAAGTKLLQPGAGALSWRLYSNEYRDERGSVGLCV